MKEREIEIMNETTRIKMLISTIVNIFCTSIYNLMFKNSDPIHTRAYLFFISFFPPKKNGCLPNKCTNEQSNNNKIYRAKTDKTETNRNETHTHTHAYGSNTRVNGFFSSCFQVKIMFELYLLLNFTK